jgi:hypothetical protein
MIPVVDILTGQIANAGGVTGRICSSKHDANDLVIQERSWALSRHSDPT